MFKHNILIYKRTLNKKIFSGEIIFLLNQLKLHFKYC